MNDVHDTRQPQLDDWHKIQCFITFHTFEGNIYFLFSKVSHKDKILKDKDKLPQI